MFILKGYPKRVVLRVCKISRSTFYKQSQPKSPDRREDNAGRPPQGYSLNLSGKKVLDIEIIDLLSEYRSQPYFENAGGHRKMVHYLRREHGVKHEFTPPSTPQKNAFIESFFSILETDFLQTHAFESFAEAYTETIKFIQFYNERRIHGSINNQSPKDFLRNWTNESKNEKQLLAA